jgi:hypothetical protein
MAQKYDGLCRSKYNLKLDREFNSPNVIGAGHMIRGAKDLPQRALFTRAVSCQMKPRKTDIQVGR